MIIAIFASSAQAVLVGPDYYKTPTAEAGKATSETFTVSIKTTLNGKPEPATVKMLDPKHKAAGEWDTSKGQPAVFKLKGGQDYRAEAFFLRLNNNSSAKIKSLSRNVNLTINLEYYNVSVASEHNGRSDRPAAGTIRVYFQRDPAHQIAVQHTDGYVPAVFLLEAHKRYVIAIRYDDSNVSANLNGKMLYDLAGDTKVTFDF